MRGVVIQRRQPGHHASQSHEVRLIGGRWKRSKLPVLDRPGLRPTPDRVRETLFNWLGQSLDGVSVLDAFAGTGALGLEAASRGAQPVLLLERDAAVARHLREAVQRLGGGADIEVVVTDAIGWMRAAAAQGRRFDLVFLDPPFAAGLFEPALQAAQALVGTGGWIYLEADEALSEAHLPTGWVAWRHARAGQVHAHLLRHEHDTAAAPACSPCPVYDRSVP